MKTKRLNILFASIFALIFLIGFASAVLEFTDPIPPDATIDYGENWAGVQFNATTDAGDVVFSINDKTHFTIDSLTGFLLNKTSLGAGTYSVTVTITNETSQTVSTLYKLQVLPKTCEYSDNGNLELTIKDISVDKGYGKDTEWLPLDEVNVEVQVRNNGDEKINNIVVKWGLYNLDTNKWVIDDKESDFNLKDGEKKTLTINFKLEDPSDFEDGDDYEFYVWATGEDKESDVDTCSRDSESIDIILESDFVILGDLEMLETVLCGSEVQISADVWNIGEDGQDEVSVIIYNKELGLNEQVEIGDINAFDSEPLDFTFQLPKDLVEKTYIIKFTVYDEDNKIYENDYNDDQSIYSVFLKVEGSCSTTAEASVTAVLESGGEAGKPLVVKATIVNTGDKTTSYSLNAADYAEWASSASLDKTSLTLDAGKSEQVLLTFNVNKDALGVKLFYLEVLAENELIVNQPVQVEITKKSGFGITGNFFSGDNKYIWGIGALNLILVILIIVIAVRISRKSKK